MELGRDVSGVAQHGEDHGPLGTDTVNDQTWDEHGGDHEGHVDDGQRGGAEAFILGGRESLVKVNLIKKSSMSERSWYTFSMP